MYAYNRNLYEGVDAKPFLEFVHADTQEADLICHKCRAITFAENVRSLQTTVATIWRPCGPKLRCL